ncbi:Uncharacterised protein [Bordetella pertussis]|nr:Uncharacterised protein [Bordetella pertussis]
MVRSYSRMMGQVSLEHDTGRPGASASAISRTRSSCAGLR